MVSLDYFKYFDSNSILPMHVNAGTHLQDAEKQTDTTVIINHISAL